ncbi:helix-turn-helix domain-containing protein, partial [Patescibacteria group bacterium]|nr:helix-turn-helix domain-containing protein [Patescibacteria group bacterium]
MLGKFIFEQRKKHNLTQDFLASKIGVSRPTFVQIEQGERDLTITEARKLADIFGIVFGDFVKGKDTSVVVDIKKGVKKRKAEKREMRISVPQKNLEKFKEVLLYILSKVGGKPNVGEAVVYKLLYF